MKKDKAPSSVPTKGFTSEVTKTISSGDTESEFELCDFSFS